MTYIEIDDRAIEPLLYSKSDVALWAAVRILLTVAVVMWGAAIALG